MEILESGPSRRRHDRDRGGDRVPLAAGPTAEANRRTLGWVAAGLAGPATIAGLLIAPADRVQGDAQRLMYLHVPAAWTAFLAFGAVLVTSVGYLVTRDLRWDRCARAAAEIGVGLTGLAIALGSIWGRAVWGTWWTWDPRLISTALLMLVYAGYLAARGSVAQPTHQVARTTAVIGIGGSGMVPVVHFSVVWWRSLHQPATILGPGRPPIDEVMAATLVLSLLAFTATGFWLFLRRVAVLEAEAAVTAAPAVAPPSAAPPGDLAGTGPATAEPARRRRDPVDVR